jgi:hypothetical protein
MARLRERRRQGKVHLSLELDPWWVTGLITLRWLDPRLRGNPAAVRDAFARFVAFTLDQRRNPQGRASAGWR